MVNVAVGELVLILNSKPSAKNILLAVVAKKEPPTAIAPFSPKTIPLGLIRKIWPLADSCPNMEDGSIPSTLFTAILFISF